MAYYKFNEGIAEADNSAIDKVIDHTGNGNNGFIDNLNLTAVTQNFVDGIDFVTEVTNSITELACETYKSPSGKTWTVTNTYIDTVSNMYGCDSIISVDLTVGTPLTFDLGDNLKICEYGTAYITGAPTADSYAWSNAETTQDINTDIEGKYTVKVTDATSCTGTDDVTVTVYYYPFVAIEDADLCYKSALVLDAGNTNATYEWSNGSTDQTLSISIDGTYTVTVTNGGICTEYGSAIITQLTVDTNVIATTDSEIMADKAGVTYSWIDCDNDYTPVATDGNMRNYTALINGNYAVIIKDFNIGCIDTSGCHNISTVGILGYDSETKLTISPNPSSGFVNLDFGTSKDNVNIKITNISGQTVITATANKTSNYRIDIAGLNKGIYFVHVSSNGQAGAGKLIKE